MVEFIPYFIDMGYNAVNPVQISAAGMAPAKIKQQFGSGITFWGGACDSQKTLPFGTAEQVRSEVQENLTYFKPNGGYVASNVHNITAEVPPENILLCSMLCKNLVNMNNSLRDCIMLFFR